MNYKVIFFFFNDTATTEIYTLSLHDALPISCLYTLLTGLTALVDLAQVARYRAERDQEIDLLVALRSEEHTSELQSPDHLVCRLLLEKKKHVKYHRLWLQGPHAPLLPGRQTP